MASIKKRTVTWKTKDGEERSKVTWRARYRDRDGEEHEQKFDRRVDAQTWLDEATADLVTGRYVKPTAGKVTFAAFYERWVPDQVWLSNTRENADLAVASTTFADVQLRNLKKRHIEAWVKTMSKTLAPTTIDTRMSVVRGILRAAVTDRVLAEDISAGVVLPRIRKPEAAMQIPTDEQVRALVTAAASPRRPGFEVLVQVAAFAGLRRGELIGLKVGDIDFLRRELHVNRQLQRAKASDIAEGKDIIEAAGGVKMQVRAPKYESERPVYLPDELVELLSIHVGGLEPGDGERWLFPVDGLPMNDNMVDYRFRSARTKAKAEAFTLHDLRHYYASGLIAAGCDVVTVQRALGHAKPTTTLSTYAHLWPNAADRTRAAAGDLMKSALSTANPAAGSTRAVTQ